MTELDIVNKWALLSFWSDKIKQSNATLFLISHDIDTLIYLCDRIVVLSDNPSKVLKEFSVTIPHARHLDFLVSDDFLNSKKLLLESIQNQQ